MTTDTVRTFITTGALGYKQDAERRYEECRQAVADAEQALTTAREDVREARAERQKAREQYDAFVKANRKPRQTNVVRRVLQRLEAGNTGMTRQQIIRETELEAASVSTTLTRCKRAGFVKRDGEDFAGLWILTEAGRDWLHSNLPMP